MAQDNLSDDAIAFLTGNKGRSVTVKLPPPRPQSANERANRETARRASRGAEFKAPPPKSLWQRLMQGLDDMQSTAGQGVIGAASRGLFRLFTDEEDEDRMERNVAEERDRRAIRDAADPAWSSDRSTVGNIAHVGAEIAGGMVGDANPTYLIGSAASTPARRIAAQGGIEAGIDSALQGIEMNEGLQEDFDLSRTAEAFLGGAALQGLGEAAVKGGQKASDALGARRSRREGEVTGYVMPVRGEITSEIGPRKAPKAGASTNHGGIDIAARVGTPVLAPADGVVTKVGRNHGKRGNWVEIQHDNGVTTRYLHLSGFKVKPGQRVAGGSAFARVGATGNVTGPHLHWSAMTPDGKIVDPRSVEYGPPIAPDGAPTARSVPPIDPAIIARIMDDPEAAGLIETADDSDNIIEASDTFAQKGEDAARRAWDEITNTLEGPIWDHINKRWLHRDSEGVINEPLEDTLDRTALTPEEKETILRGDTFLERFITAKNFLREEHDYRPGDLDKMSPEDAIAQAEARGFNDEWHNYYDFAYRNAWDNSVEVPPRPEPTPTKGPSSVTPFLREKLPELTPDELRDMDARNAPLSEMTKLDEEWEAGRITWDEYNQRLADIASRNPNTKMAEIHDLNARREFNKKEAETRENDDELTEWENNRAMAREFLTMAQNGIGFDTGRLRIEAKNIAYEMRVHPSDDPKIQRAMEDTFNILNAALAYSGVRPEHIPSSSKNIGGGRKETPANDPDAPKRRSIGQILKDLLNDESGELRGDGDGPSSKGPEQQKPQHNMAGSIDLDRVLASKDVKAQIREMANEAGTSKEDHIQWKRRAEALIDEHGVDGIILKKEWAPEDLPAFSYAIRSVHIAAQRRLVDVAKAVVDPEQSTPVLQDILTNVRVLAGAAFERTNNIAGVAGRLLNAHKLMVGRGKIVRDSLKRIEQMTGNDIDPIRLAQLIVQHADSNPDAIGALASHSLKPKAQDYIFSMWFNFLLSGIKTHVANITGNGSHIALDLLDHGFASVFGKLRGGDDKVTATELAARLHGMRAGATVGFSNMKVAFNVGSPLDLVGKIDNPRVFTKGPAKLLETPTRALAAEDEFFRSVANLSEIYGLAARQAKKEGLEGDALATRIEELQMNPTAEMTSRAIDYARRMRFNDTPSRVAQGLEAMRRRTTNPNAIEQAWNVVIHAVIPFVRVLDRLTAATFRHIPLVGWDRVNLEDWKAGGARRDLVKGRMTVGAILLGTVAMMAADDEGTVGITGAGPKNWRRRQELEATGWQPYSIRVGNKYYNYRQIQPLAGLFGTMSTAVEQMKEEGADDESWTRQAMQMLQGAMGSLMDGSFMSSVSGFFEATNDPSGTAMENFIASLAAAVSTPAILRQINQSYIDPTVRMTTGDGSLEDRVKGRVMSGIPGLSDNLPARHDVFGEPIVREGALGPDIASPMTTRTISDDFVRQEIRRLQKDKRNALLNPPKNRVKVNGEDRKLSDKEYQEYVKLSGQLFSDMMADTITMSPDWVLMTDEERRDAAKKTMTAARKAAREQLFSSEELSGDALSFLEGL